MQTVLNFVGSDYVEERDEKRLKNQHYKVFNLMKDGKFRTLPQIADIIKELV